MSDDQTLIEKQVQLWKRHDKATTWKERKQIEEAIKSLEKQKRGIPLILTKLKHDPPEPTDSTS